MNERPTHYRIEIVCDDLGEYDALFLTKVAMATVELLGANGIHDFEIRSTRRRAGEFS